MIVMHSYGWKESLKRGKSQNCAFEILVEMIVFPVCVYIHFRESPCYFEREREKTVGNLMEKPQLSVAKKIRRKIEDENGPFSSWAFRQVKQFSFCQCLRRTVRQYDNLIVIFLHEKFISNFSYRINYPSHTQRIETEKSKVYLIPSISTRFIKSCEHFMFQFLEISETNISIRSLACTKTKVTIW